MNSTIPILKLMLTVNLILLAGSLLGNYQGLAAALLLCFCAWILASFIAVKETIKEYSAHPLSPDEDPDIHHAVTRHTVSTGFRNPSNIYMVQDPTPNAFTAGLGTKTTAICLTTGIRELLDRRELQAVLAHEMIHLRNRHNITLIGLNVFNFTATAASIMTWMPETT